MANTNEQNRLWAKSRKIETYLLKRAVHLLQRLYISCQCMDHDVAASDDAATTPISTRVNF